MFGEAVWTVFQLLNSDLFVYSTGSSGTEAVPEATPISDASAPAEQTLPYQGPGNFA